MCVFSCVAMKHSLSHGYCTGRMSAQYVLCSHSLQSMHSSDWFAGSLVLLGFAYVLLDIDVTECLYQYFYFYNPMIDVISIILSSIMFRSWLLHRPV